MLKGLFVQPKNYYDMVYGPSEREDISHMVDIYADLQTPEQIKENPGILHDADVLFSGWGMPVIDSEFLSAAPNLKIIFYGSGAVKSRLTDQVWQRGIRVTSSFIANAIPVAEFTLSQILFCLKLGWQYVMFIKNNKGWRWEDRGPTIGAYGSTVGLISLGVISHKLIELLQPYDINILVHSAHLTKEKAAELNVKPCSLDDIFKKSDVISLHSPDSPRTKGMIKGEHFSSMKKNASFINTARGAVVRENELIEVFAKRQDLVAVLDVTDPEPTVHGSPFYTLPNIIITPHIAGSMGDECYRMGRYMVDEFKHYMTGEPLKGEVTREDIAYLA